MRTLDLIAGACLFAGAAWLPLACGDSAGAELLQDPCVRDEIPMSSDLVDGEECFNIGYEGCEGFASDCIHYCAFDVCQAGPCASNGDCDTVLGDDGECADFVIDDRSFGRWCRVSDCPPGSLGCPCDAGSCDADPFGGGAMSCEGGVCESGCAFECRQGESTCCGGAFCSGDCVGSPCC
jgi:hypothetical protein